MTFTEQLVTIFETIRDHVSIEPYMEREMSAEHKTMLNYMVEVGKSEPVNCCLRHRGEAIMSVWCGGLSIGIQLYQMFGEASDLRDLLEERQIPGEEEHHG